MDITIFHKLLISAIQKGASDIHLLTGYQPMFRINGDLVEVKYHPLTPEETYDISSELIKNHHSSIDLNNITEMDLSYGITGCGRFRVNIFRQRGTFGIVLRVIPLQISSFEELNLPSSCSQISNLHRGLILVTGATGNGKSTTIAAMLEQINKNRRCHIITIEDPIEFLFDHKMAVISQRELGNDTKSFTSALTSALRQDPDVIMIGEMREMETVDIALKAAETGHLVISSLHTTDASKTISRLIGFYPFDVQPIIRHRISESLMAIVSLRLLPQKGSLTRIPATEILRVTRSVQECIKNQDKMNELPSIMEKSREQYGMQTFDQHIIELYKEGKIDKEIARLAVSSPGNFERSITIDA